MKKLLRMFCLIFVVCFALCGGGVFCCENAAAESYQVIEQCAENGAAVPSQNCEGDEEEAVHITENIKEDFDMSNVRWAKSSFTYDGEEHTVALTGLPDGLTAEYTGNSATNAGSYTASVTFVYDTEKYNEPDYSNTTLSWKISKAVIDITNLEWSETSFLYDGEEHTVTLLNVPDSLEVTYEGNVGTAAGTYQATATFTYDEDNYELTEEANYVFLIWTISSGKSDNSSLVIGLVFSLAVVGIIALSNFFSALKKRRG